MKIVCFDCSFCKGFQVNLFKKDFLSLGCSCIKSQAGYGLLVSNWTADADAPTEQDVLKKKDKNIDFCEDVF